MENRGAYGMFFQTSWVVILCLVFFVQ